MPSPPRVTFQLYSSHALPQDAAVLDLVRGAGFTGVETFGPWNENPEKTRHMIDARGLTVPSLHMALQRLRDDTAGVIKIARALGAGLVAAPYVAEADRPSSADGWRALARELETVSTQLKNSGLGLAWHNHDFEFAPTEGDQVPLYLLASAAPSLSLELDIGWAVRAGQDPLGLIRRFGRRIAALHVKDVARPGDPTARDGWADVGAGTVDWAAIVRAARAHDVALFVIEHDNPPDVAAFARNSLKAFNAVLTGVA